MENTDLESYDTEAEVLLAWRDLVVREDPDIIIGYNIFGFDYNFMFMRARETGCAPAFLEMSKIKDHCVAPSTKRQGSTRLNKAVSRLRAVPTSWATSRCLDVSNWICITTFRREENLVSYKLDYVAGHFIGDYVSKLEPVADAMTVIHTKNMSGLLVDSYVHFEEIGHSTDY